MKINTLWTVGLGLLVFILGAALAVYAVTSGPGGIVKLQVGSNKFEIVINEVDLKKLLSNDKYAATAKEAAIIQLGLFQLDDKLINHLRKLDYNDSFAKPLRDMSDALQGPFNAPDKNVELVFSERIPEGRAEVCPGSDFYKNRLNVALSDLTRMVLIERADIAAVHGCPTPPEIKEKIVVNVNIGKDMVNADKLPPSIAAVAKVLPGYIIFPEKH